MHLPTITLHHRRHASMASLLILLLRPHLAAAVWYHEPTAATLDSCDSLKWRICKTSADCVYNEWRQSTFMGPNTQVPMWESEMSYNYYGSYDCVSPEEEYGMEGCAAKRCVPELKSAFACGTNGDCPDGQVCADEFCVSCGAGADPTQATHFSHGACHQVFTTGNGDGVPSYAEGQSGCAGDHCLTSCAYDTQCVRVLSDTAELDLTATHNQLSNKLVLSAKDRQELGRPSECEGANDGMAGSGMRCAADIYRTITSRIQTPDEVRDHNADVVELSVLKGDHEKYVTFSEDDLEHRALKIDENWDRGYNLGYVVPTADIKAAADTELGVRIVGAGVLAHQPRGVPLEDWDRRGLIQCEVKYVTDAPLHTTRGGVDTLDKIDRERTRSTLLTRVCIRLQGDDDGGGHVWGDMHFVDDYQMRCGKWGTVSASSTADHYNYGFKVKCTLSGPNVKGIIPTVAQRDRIGDGLLSAFQNGTIQIHDVLRLSFHDAAAYTPDAAAVLGGARGCMRFEHVHGNPANLGLAGLMEDFFWEAIGCQPGKLVDWQTEECWSMADALQYAGAVAVDAALGPSFSDAVKWGRPDAPRLFCTGELQLTMPDATAGHRAGAEVFGSSNVSDRLQTVFKATKAYFEQQLLLSHEDWIAYLAGGHSVGGVKGLIEAKNTRFNFDATPLLFDNLYLERVDRSARTSLMSLCPQMAKMGDSFWWEPTANKVHEGGGSHDALLDTDVSLTTDAASMTIIRDFAHNEEAFFRHYVNAALQVSELGYGDRLVSVGPAAPLTTSPSAATTDDSPTPSPTFSPTHCSDDSDCNDGIFCNGIEVCEPSRGCVTNVTCPGEICLEESESCVECLGSDDCDNQNIFSHSGTGCTINQCTNDGQCLFNQNACGPNEECNANNECVALASYDSYQDVGYCISEIDEQVDGAATAEECLNLCKLEFPDFEQLFVEFINGGECYCQNECTCMDDLSSAGRTTFTPTGVDLPAMCCSDDPSWRFKGKRTCEWVGKKPSRRCRKTGNDKRKAHVACKKACDSCDR